MFIDLVRPIRIFALDLRVGNNHITVVNMYRPHAVNKLLYIRDLSRYLSTSRLGEVELLEDINSDIAEMDDVSEYYQYPH